MKYLPYFIAVACILFVGIYIYLLKKDNANYLNQIMQYKANQESLVQQIESQSCNIDSIVNTAAQLNKERQQINKDKREALNDLYQKSPSDSIEFFNNRLQLISSETY